MLPVSPKVELVGLLVKKSIGDMIASPLEKKKANKSTLRIAGKKVVEVITTTTNRHRACGRIKGLGLHPLLVVLTTIRKSPNTFPHTIVSRGL